MHSATCAQAARARRAYQSSRRLRLEEWYGARTGAAPSVTTALDYRAPVTRERARAKASHGCEDDSTDTSLHGACALKTGSDHAAERVQPSPILPPSPSLTTHPPVCSTQPCTAALALVGVVPSAELSDSSTSPQCVADRKTGIQKPRGRRGLRLRGGGSIQGDTADEQASQARLCIPPRLLGTCLVLGYVATAGSTDACYCPWHVHVHTHTHTLTSHPYAIPMPSLSHPYPIPILSLSYPYPIPIPSLSHPYPIPRASRSCPVPSLPLSPHALSLTLSLSLSLSPPHPIPIPSLSHPYPLVFFNTNCVEPA